MNIEILIVNLNMSPIHVKCVKISLFILASMGLHGEIVSINVSVMMIFLFVIIDLKFRVTI